MNKLSLNQRYLMQPLIIRFMISIFVIIFILILLQNPQIFPGAVVSIFNKSERNPNSLPEQVESIFIDTKDQKKIEAWRLGNDNSKQVAIIFHGNGGDVANFFSYQEYFKSMEITSYGFDYRGYGKSTGWPTEKGINLDGEAVIEYLIQRENILPKDIIIVGVSIGSGPASYIADKYQVGTLLLYSPFTSLKNAVKSQKILGFLHPFLIYKFPVLDHIKNLGNTCLIVAHGKRDGIIPFSQGQEIYLEHKKIGKSYLEISKTAGHNDILFETFEPIKKYLFECLENKFSPF